MKSVIYYFTGTGNSLKVAKDIAQKLDNTTLISISKVIGTDIDLSVDNIGIIFPVYSWGMPLMVSRFIKKLQTENAKYFFAIATCAGNAASTLLQTKKELETQNINLSSGFIVKMPTNYIVWGDSISVEKQQKLFDTWETRVDGIANVIKKQQKNEIEKDSFLINFLLSKLIYPLAITKFAQMDKSFWADNKCNQCQICKSVCPASNIDLIEGKPSWNHKCEQCLACIQWCPKQSIQIGKKTQNRKRYNNPFVTLKEML